MIVELVLLMQAAASLPPQDALPLLDLHGILLPEPCAAGAGDEIVVCGRKIDPEHFRLHPLGKGLDTSAMPKAETTIFGSAKLSVEGETATIGGAPSNRMMLKLKTPF